MNIGANVCRALHSVVIDIPRCVKDSPHLRGGDVYEGIVLEVAGGVVVDGAYGLGRCLQFLARFDPLIIYIYYISFLCRSYFFIIRNTLLRR